MHPAWIAGAGLGPDHVRRVALRVCAEGIRARGVEVGIA
jgi:hypothetical protein